MLTKIRLQNFKAHRSSELEARRLTLLIGPNNSGKSSMGQAVLLLRQAAAGGKNGLSIAVQRKPTTLADPYLYTDNVLIDLGDFGHIVRRGEHEIVISLEGQLDSPPSSGLSAPLRVAFEVRFTEDGLAFHRGGLQFESPLTQQRELRWQWAGGGPARLPLGLLSLSAGRIQLQAIENLQLLGGQTVMTDGTAPPQDLTQMQALGSKLVSAPLSLMKSVHPIFPLRGLEERGSPLTEGPAQNLERMSVADRTVALLSMLAYNLELQEKVSDWLEDLIERRIKVPLLPGKRVTLLSVPPRQKGADSLFTNEGTGANQLPFLLVPIGITPPGETILLTEPEAHLHPLLQSKLSSLLLDLSLNERRQFIIETHSEHVLHRFLHAVASGELSTKDLAIYYFEKKNGEAECRMLEVNEKGQVPGGLPGFFDQSLHEVSDYLEALKKN